MKIGIIYFMEILGLLLAMAGLYLWIGWEVVLTAGGLLLATVGFMLEMRQRRENA